MRDFFLKSAGTLAAICALLPLGGLEAVVRDEFYGGGGCGASYNHFKIEATNTVTTKKIIKHGKKTECFGPAFLGFGYTIRDRFYVAGELGSSYPRRAVTIKRPDAAYLDSIFTDHMSVKEYFYVDFLEGYRFLCDFLFYGRVGASYGHLTLHENSLVIDGVTLASLKKRENTFGLRLGAGLNYAITDYIGVGVDYIYTGYPSNSKLNSFTSVEHSQKIQIHYVGASLIFNLPMGCIWWW